MMVNRGLGSPSQCGGPDRLLMSPWGGIRSVANPRSDVEVAPFPAVRRAEVEPSYPVFHRSPRIGITVDDHACLNYI